MAIESGPPSRRASMARPGAAARISQTLRESDERASHRHRQRHGRGAFGRGTGQACARPLRGCRHRRRAAARLQSGALVGAAGRGGRLLRYRAQTGAMVARPRRDLALRRARDRGRSHSARSDAVERHATVVFQAGLCDRLAADQARHPRNGSAGRAHLVVIGGGLLGLEAAYGLAKARAHVTVLHLMDRLMERQLDERAARLLKRAVEAKGIAVHLEAETTRIIGNGRVEAVELRDGSVIPADAVVVAAGIRANTALARTAGLKVNGGIVVDDHLETSVAGVHAIGECAEHRGRCYGLVEPAYEQAQVLARRLAGENATYPGSVLAANLKVSGVNVFSACDFLAATVGADEIVLSDPGIGLYKKLVIAAGRLIGAVLFGDTADGPWYLDLIRSGSSIERLRDDLVFGRDLATRVAA